MNGISHNKTKEKSVSKLYFLLTIIYITLILTSNILAGRLIMIANLSLTGAVLLFPITYILGDIFTEVYGFEKNKQVIWLTFICNIIMTLCFIFVINLPYPNTFKNADAFKVVLGFTPKVLISSMLGLIIGSFLNSIVMSRLKIITKGKYLALRTILSTVVGELADTTIFLLIAFCGSLPNNILINMIICQFIVKIIIEVIGTPITYLLIDKVKKKENIDTYDYDIKYKLI